MNKAKYKQSALCILLGIFSLGASSAQSWDLNNHHELPETKIVASDTRPGEVQIEELLWMNPILDGEASLYRFKDNEELHSIYIEKSYEYPDRGLEAFIKDTLIRELESHGYTSIAEKFKTEATALEISAAMSCIEAVEILLENGTPIQGGTSRPLYYALTYGKDIRLIWMLIDRGARLIAEETWEPFIQFIGSDGNNDYMITHYWEKHIEQQGTPARSEFARSARMWPWLPKALSASIELDSERLLRYFLEKLMIIDRQENADDSDGSPQHPNIIESINRLYSYAITSGRLKSADILAEYGAEGNYIDSVYRIAYEYIDHVKNHPFETGLSYACALGGFAGAHYLGGQYLPGWAEKQIHMGIMGITQFTLRIPLARASQKLLNAQAATQELQATLGGLTTDEAAAKAAVKAAQRALTEVGSSSASLQELTGKSAAEWTQTITQHMKDLVNDHEYAIRSLSAYDIPNKPQAYYDWFKDNFEKQVEDICNGLIPDLGEAFRNSIQKIANYQFFLALQEKAGWAKALKLARPTQLWDAVTNPAWIQANEAVKTAQANLEGAKQVIQQTQSQLTAQNSIIEREQAKQLQFNERANAAGRAKAARIRTHINRLRAEASESFSRKMARIGLGLGGAYAGYELCGSAGAYIDDWMFDDSSDN